MPVRARAGKCGGDGLDDDEVHELAVDDLLEWKRPHIVDGLAVQAERVGTDRDLKEGEGEPAGDDQFAAEEQDALEREEVDVHIFLRVARMRLDGCVYQLVPSADTLAGVGAAGHETLP